MSETKTIAKPVPLEEVVAKIPVKQGDGFQLQDLNWDQLNGIEQQLVKLIADGKYGEACDLSGHGQAHTYKRVNVGAFLRSASLQSRSDIGLGLLNDNVRTILGDETKDL